MDITKQQGVESWLYISQLKKAQPDIWSLANYGDLQIYLTRKIIADVKVDCFLSAHSSHEDCFFVFPHFISDHPFSNLMP